MFSELNVELTEVSTRSNDLPPEPPHDGLYSTLSIIALVGSKITTASVVVLLSAENDACSRGTENEKKFFSNSVSVVTTTYEFGAIFGIVGRIDALVEPASEIFHPEIEIVSMLLFTNSIHSGIPLNGAYMNSLMSSVRDRNPTLITPKTLLFVVSSSPFNSSLAVNGCLPVLIFG